jgi:hypothetical protein
MSRRAATEPAAGIVSILFTDLFDSLSTFIGVATAAGLTEPDGRPLNLRRGLIVDAFATFVAGLAAHRLGPRTWKASPASAWGANGMTSVVTALCFLPCFFVAPLAARCRVCDGPGARAGRRRDVPDGVADRLLGIEDALPAFVTLVLIPLTFSITQGILCGFILHALLYACVGRARESAGRVVAARGAVGRAALSSIRFSRVNPLNPTDPTVLWRMARGHSTAHATIIPGDAQTTITWFFDDVMDRAENYDSMELALARAEDIRGRADSGRVGIPVEPRLRVNRYHGSNAGISEAS